MNIESKVSAVKKGDFVRFKDSDSAPVWVKGDFNRSDKRFEFHKFDDVNHFSQKKSSAKCFIGFDF